MPPLCASVFICKMRITTAVFGGNYEGGKRSHLERGQACARECEHGHSSAEWLTLTSGSHANPALLRKDSSLSLSINLLPTGASGLRSKSHFLKLCCPVSSATLLYPT